MNEIINEFIQRANKEVMALAELKQDNLYLKIPTRQRKYYIDESIKIGIQVAESIKEKHKNKSIEALCQLYNIRINIIGNKQISKYLNLRAEYLNYNNQINIYQSSMEKMMQQFAQINVDLTYQEILEIHLAHEFFHFLEFNMIGITSDHLQPIKMKRLLLKNSNASVLKTREIAAHTFCLKYLNLKIHPKFLDYLFLLSNGEINEIQLSSYLEKLQLEIEKM